LIKHGVLKAHGKLTHDSTHTWNSAQWLRSVFLNRRAAARYRALASIIPGRERLSWNLSF